MSAKIQNNNSKIEIDTSCARQSDKKMKFLSWYYKYTESAILNYFKMPSTPYDLVQDDQDLRIPLHAEQAFFHGITFQAKVSSYSSMDSVHFISFFPFGVYFLSWILCCFQICIRIRLISLCNRKQKTFSLHWKMCLVVCQNTDKTTVAESDRERERKKVAKQISVSGIIVIQCSKAF